MRIDTRISLPGRIDSLAVGPDGDHAVVERDGGADRTLTVLAA